MWRPCAAPHRHMRRRPRWPWTAARRGPGCWRRPRELTRAGARFCSTARRYSTRPAGSAAADAPAAAGSPAPRRSVRLRISSCAWRTATCRRECARRWRNEHWTSDLRVSGRTARGDHQAARHRRGRSARNARPVPRGARADRVLGGRAGRGRQGPRGAEARRADRALGGRGAVTTRFSVRRRHLDSCRPDARSKGDRTRMPLCFIEPQEAIRVVAESVGREARRQLLGEVVRAWVDEIPEDELEAHYAKAVDELDADDLSMLAAWHASLEVGHPVANKEFLLKAFPGLGELRREALRIAAGFRGDEAFDAGVSEEQALDTVLPWLSEQRAFELAAEAVELYCWDRLGSDN